MKTLLTAILLALTFGAATAQLPADFPPVRTEVLGETAPGLIFLNVAQPHDDVGFYIMMLANDGTPVFYRDLVTDYSYDFKVQPNGNLSYAQFLNHYNFTGGGDAEHIVLGPDFEVADRWQMKNGYTAEVHDFLLLPNGHAVMIAYHLEPRDLSDLGGHPRAMVAASIIQEQDSDRNVVFEWRSTDHFELTDALSANFGRPAFDPVHVNSITLDHDGHLLATFNSLSELTKINRQTGEIIWRLGGKNNQFAFEGLEPAQHAVGLHNVTRLDNGNILFFDNTPRGSDQTARAVEYQLDEEQMVATLVWQYAPEEPVLGLFRGSAQRLPNGNTLIGWGTASNGGGPVATEVNSDGEEVFRLWFDIEGMSSYRALRFPYPPAAAAVTTEFELLIDNTYNFTQDGVAVGAQLRLDELAGDGYNEVTLSRHDYAPAAPEFFGKAPLLRPVRFALVQQGIQEFTGELRFDAAALAIPRPEEAVVLHRRVEGRGLFLPLPTSYNGVSGRIVAQVAQAGEFVIGHPDLPSVALSPLLVEPVDQTSVNQDGSVQLRWTPRGYVRDYALQVARDPDFAELVVDATDLSEALFVLEEVDDETQYYWRARVGNDAGDSDWSSVSSFMTAPPSIALVAPQADAQLQRGLEHFVYWDTNIDSEVAVELHRGGTLVAVLDTMPAYSALNWEIDPALPTGSDYSIRLVGLENGLMAAPAGTFAVIDTVVTAVVGAAQKPVDFALGSNYPNPFNPLTTIAYQVPRRASVTLEIYSLLGQRVRRLVDQVQLSGHHTVTWNGTDDSGRSVASGVYLYRLRSGHYERTRTMVLVK
ncbi:MAG: T9SS type A sorting domain-containing protein [Candidatus Latescibacteria bacterium]|nr:T9SS type A sorting domain-containing protein [Candidatus Latescibacterota bacterium]